MLLKIGGGFLTVGMGVISALSLVVYQAGFATVEVHDEDVDLVIPVPLALLDVALALAPEGELREIRRQIGPHRETLLALADQLSELPDVTLVDAYDHGETVIVSTQDQQLIVDVDSADETVRVEVPLSAIRRILYSVARDAVAD